MIPPGATIGILGGGQLGRMSAMAARSLGYGIVVWDSDAQCPAAAVADSVIAATFNDTNAAERFAAACDVITLEFENIPADVVRHLESTTPVRPGSRVLHICQHREREKRFLQEHGFPCARFAIADSRESFLAGVQEIGLPCVAKTAAWGYDGKGQSKIKNESDVDAAWETLGGERVVIEEWMHFSTELSVICARNASGQVEVFPPGENIHTNHILDVSLVPGRFSMAMASSAARIAQEVADKLELEGLLAVEMFLCKNDRLVINELAPRPHNSGHYSLDACDVSQFEQHIRAVCDLPLARPRLFSPAVMVNLLGDVWHPATPAWQEVLGEHGAHLHLYGKKQARAGRKMGHYTVLADDVSTAETRAEDIRRRLLK